MTLDWVETERLNQMEINKETDRGSVRGDTLLQQHHRRREETWIQRRGRGRETYGLVVKLYR